MRVDAQERIMRKMVADIILPNSTSADGVLGLMNITGDYYDTTVCKFAEIMKVRFHPSITERAWMSLGRNIKKAQVKLDSINREV